jgi:3-deoxy-7-phosphoheptulonate synthase
VVFSKCALILKASKAEAIEIAKQVKAEVQLPFVSEITDPRQIDLLYDAVDIFQVGARNMHNYELLKELGQLKKPVLLKRGFAAYLDEFIAASEYLINAGNWQVTLCERGIRTFERSIRNTLDLSSVPYLQKRTGLPVIVDPSHSTGVRELVTPMCWAAAAAGAHGLIVEVHQNPAKALSDGPQALTLEDFENMVPKLIRVLDAVDGLPLRPPSGLHTASLKHLPPEKVSPWMN